MREAQRIEAKQILQPAEQRAKPRRCCRRLAQGFGGKGHFVSIERKKNKKGQQGRDKTANRGFARRARGKTRQRGVAS